MIYVAGPSLSQDGKAVVFFSAQGVAISYTEHTLLRSPGSRLQAADVRESSTGRLIRQGILTSVLNPKGLLF